MVVQLAPGARHLKTARRTHAHLLCGPSAPVVELSFSAYEALLPQRQFSCSGNTYRVGGSSMARIWR
jgi:hypothetical protein